MGDLLRRYWGFLALAFALAGWLSLALGKVTTAIVGLLLLVSVGALGYFLFQAPLWCGAITREGALCRNNSSGLLIGCHLREHKWQKLKMTFVPKAWRQLNPWTVGNSPGRSEHACRAWLGGLGSGSGGHDPCREALTRKCRRARYVLLTVVAAAIAGRACPRFQRRAAGSTAPRRTETGTGNWVGPRSRAGKIAYRAGARGRRG